MGSSPSDAGGGGGKLMLAAGGGQPGTAKTPLASKTRHSPRKREENVIPATRDSLTPAATPLRYSSPQGGTISKSVLLVEEAF